MIIVIPIGIAIGLLSVVAGVLYLVSVNVLSVDAVGWLQVLSERIVRRAAALHLPDFHRDREEEWLAELEQYRNRPITMLVIALRISRNAMSAGIEASRSLESTAAVVDGTHLALALVGRRAKVETLNADVTVTPAVARFVGDLQAALGAMPNDSGLGDVDAVTWLKDVVGLPDSVERVLHRFRRSDLCPFFDELDTKFATMGRLSAGTTGVPASVLLVFDTLHELLMDLESFEDYGLFVVGELRLDEKRDLEGLERYRSLLGGIFTDEEISARVSDMTRSWWAHRAVAAS